MSGLLSLVLAAVLALVVVAPGTGFQSAEMQRSAAFFSGAGETAHPCHGGDGGAAGDCAAVQHHCAGCIVAIAAAILPVTEFSRSTYRTRSQVHVARALESPRVPHGPPRLA